MKPVHVSKPKDELAEIEEEIIDLVRRPKPSPECLVKRPPVIAILGHVDHGKTTLLDALRKSMIAQGEAGGITQHIGAFRVKLGNEAITVLDTPGHAAFSSLRARGANATDIAVLVIAGDDGIMPQTKESLELLRKSKVTIIVAVTMTDKPGYNLKRVKQQLIEVGLPPEDLGGDTQVIPICAPKGEGLKELSDAVLAEAEVLGIKGDPTGPVEGFIIESTVATNRGGMKAATMLVQRGTLRKGDVLVCGTAICKVKLLLNDLEKPVDEVGPGEAALVFGWKEMPPAAEIVLQAENEPHAGKVVNYRKRKETEERAALDAAIADEKYQEHQELYRKERKERLEQGYFKRRPSRLERQPEERVDSGGKPKLSLVIKADTDGSIEALLGILSQYRSQKCDLAIVHYGIGPVTQNDVEMATPFNAEIICFNAKVGNEIRALIDQRKLKVIESNIIYRLLEAIKDELTAKLPPKIVDEPIGEAQVLQVFSVTENKKKQPVAGSRVKSGELTRNDLYRVTRKGEVVFDGNLGSLRHFKQDVPNVSSGQECGLRFGDAFLPENGDTVLCYRKITLDDEIDWDP